MDVPSPVDAVLAPSRQVGAYFGLVSGITSLIPVGFLFVLVTSGAPGRRPSMSALAGSLSSLGLRQIAFVAIATLVTGLVLHPLQFGLTQILEGYWGSRKAARLAMARSSDRQIDRWYRLTSLSRSASERLEQIDAEYDANETVVEAEDSKFWQRTPARTKQRMLVKRRLFVAIDEQEAHRALGFYPNAVGEIMPTRLGNVLRRFETQARDFYGLDPVVALPYAGLLAGDRERAYLDDQRSSMDLAIRLTLIWALCTLISVPMLWRYDVWLVVPATTYGLILLSYKGAVRSAMFYGSAITAVLTLTQHSLRERLRLPRPVDSESERELNEQLTAWLQGEPAHLPYGEGEYRSSPELRSEMYLP